MQELFNMISSDVNFMTKCEKNPILGATFYALNEYVKAGNELSELPWFNLTKMSSRKNVLASKAA